MHNNDAPLTIDQKLLAQEDKDRKKNEKEEKKRIEK